MANKILSVRNIQCENLGTLREFFVSDGFEIHDVLAEGHKIPLKAEEYKAIIILGGPMSVYDELDTLKREEQLIRNAILHRIPLLGICLGSQLIASTVGGRVYKGNHKEIGWYNVKVTETGRKEIFNGITSDNLRVFQWHGDTYDLPDAAKILAGSQNYIQAFRIGCAIGVQFHLEVNEIMIRDWIEQYKQEITQERIELSQMTENIGTQVNDVASLCRVMYCNFLKFMNHIDLYK
jgi:GMP synthase (glutamine-hydrolysing)